MDLTKVKKQIRKTRPRFLRSGAVHIKRVSRSGYRRPKGLQNKMGDNRRGHRAQISTGFGYPKALRGSNREGLKIVTVTRESELAELNPKEQAVLVSGTLGLKRKIPLFKACVEKGFVVQNVTQIESHIKRLEENQSAAGKESKEKKTTRRATQEAAAKAAAGKDVKKKAKAAKKAEASKDDEKNAAKKEQDKVLAGKKQ